MRGHSEIRGDLFQTNKLKVSDDILNFPAPCHVCVDFIEHGRDRADPGVCLRYVTQYDKIRFMRSNETHVATGGYRPGRG